MRSINFSLFFRFDLNLEDTLIILSVLETIGLLIGDLLTQITNLPQIFIFLFNFVNLIILLF